MCGFFVATLMTLSLVCLLPSSCDLLFFFFNDAATTEIYTLSLHDALPISGQSGHVLYQRQRIGVRRASIFAVWPRSEEHTSELQSRVDLVCRLLLEKKKKKDKE